MNVSDQSHVTQHETQNTDRFAQSLSLLFSIPMLIRFILWIACYLSSSRVHNYLRQTGGKLNICSIRALCIWVPNCVWLVVFRFSILFVNTLGLLQQINFQGLFRNQVVLVTHHKLELAKLAAHLSDVSPRHKPTKILYLSLWVHLASKADPLFRWPASSAALKNS